MQRFSECTLLFLRRTKAFASGARPCSSIASGAGSINRNQGKRAVSVARLTLWLIRPIAACAIIASAGTTLRGLGLKVWEVRGSRHKRRILPIFYGIFGPHTLSITMGSAYPRYGEGKVQDSQGVFCSKLGFPVSPIPRVRWRTPTAECTPDRYSARVSGSRWGVGQNELKAPRPVNLHKFFQHLWKGTQCAWWSAGNREMNGLDLVTWVRLFATGLPGSIRPPGRGPMG
jgi:hypothetical protein